MSAALTTSCRDHKNKAALVCLNFSYPVDTFFKRLSSEYFVVQGAGLVNGVVKMFYKLRVFSLVLCFTV